jgi:hypothetical protein
LPAVQWKRTFGGTDEETLAGFGVTSEGTPVAAGVFGATVDFNAGANPPALVKAHGRDAYVLRLMDGGSYASVSTLSVENARIHIGSLFVARDGTVLLGGVFDDPIAILSHGFVAKVRPDGTVAWTRTLEGDSSSANFVTMTGDGGVVFGGAFRGTVDLDPGPGVSRVVGGPGYGAYVVKLDPDGHYLSNHRFHGQTSLDTAWITGVDVSRDGADVLVSGYFTGTIGFSQNAPKRASAGKEDALLITIPADFRGMQITTFGGEGRDVINAVASAPDRRIALTGEFQSVVQVENALSLRSNGASDCFVMHVNEFGRVVWARTIGKEFVRCRDVAVSRDGLTAITGEFAGTVDFNLGRSPQVSRTAAPNQTELFVARWRADGSDPWAMSLSRSGSEDESVFYTTDGALVFGGGFESIALDPISGADRRSAIGANDVFVIRLAPETR